MAPMTLALSRPLERSRCPLDSDGDLDGLMARCCCTAGGGRPDWISQDAQVCRRSCTRGFFVRPAARARATAGGLPHLDGLATTTVPSGLRQPLGGRRS